MFMEPNYSKRSFSLQRSEMFDLAEPYIPLLTELSDSLGADL